MNILQTNRLRLLLFPLGFLLILFSFSGCKPDLGLEKVQDPIKAKLAGVLDCQVFLIGQVLDVSTQQPVPGAEIRVGDEITNADADGMYRLQVPDPLDEIDLIRLMAVRQQGYEMDTYQFTPTQWVDPLDCEGSITYICIDVVLTPRQYSLVAQPDADTKLQVRDTMYFLIDSDSEGFYLDTQITVLDLLIPAGSVDVPTTVWLTPYSRASYVGAMLPGYSLDLPLLRFRISTQPMITLKKQFILSFTPDHPIPFVPGDPLKVYRTNGTDKPFKIFDPSTNLWMTYPNAMVGFHQPSQTVQVRSTVLGSYLVTNETYSIWINPAYAYGSELGMGTLSNCECGEANTFFYNVMLNGDMKYQMMNGGNYSVGDRLLFLNDAKVLANLPFASLIKIKAKQANGQFNVFLPDPFKTFQDEAILDKCEELDLSSRDLYGSTGGTIYGNGVNLTWPVGIQYRFGSRRCPTSSPCHQGCP